MHTNDRKVAAAAAATNGKTPPLPLTASLIHRVGPLVLPADQRLPPSLEQHAVRVSDLHALLSLSAKVADDSQACACPVLERCSETMTGKWADCDRDVGVVANGHDGCLSTRSAASDMVYGNAAEDGRVHGGSSAAAAVASGEDSGGDDGVSVLNVLLSFSLRRALESNSKAGALGGTKNSAGAAVAAAADAEAAIKAATGQNPKGDIFLQSLVSEITRVRRFLRGSLEALSLRLAHAAERLQIAQAAGTVSSSSGGGGGGVATMTTAVTSTTSAVMAAAEAAELRSLCANLRAECDEIGDQLVELEEFERYNSAEFAELGLLHDRKAAVAAKGATGPAFTSAAAATAGALPAGEVKDPGAAVACIQNPLFGVPARGGGGGSGGGNGGSSFPAAEKVGSEAASAYALMSELDIRRVYHRCIQDYLLGGFTYDMVLVGLSDVYEAIRCVQARHSKTTDTSPWVPPDQFKRSTTKYWIDPRDVVRVKATIVRHLPVLIFGRKSGGILPTEIRDAVGGASAVGTTAAAGMTAAASAPSAHAALMTSTTSRIAPPTKQPPPPPTPSLKPTGSSSFAPLANGAFSPPQPSPPPPQPLAPVPAALAAPPPPPPPPIPMSVKAPVTTMTTTAKWHLTTFYMYDSSKITSVYFDNKQLDIYHERLVRGDGASLVRIRWYGMDVPSQEQGVFVERKKHRDAWTGEFSLKERAQLVHRDVSTFLAGSPLPAMQLPLTHGSMSPPPSDSQVKAAALLREVQASLIQRNQEPHLRTEYRRTAFQLSSTNAVRISLDTQLTMTRELGAPREPGGWCRDISLSVRHEDVVRFPYAVLEIKLQDEDSCPSWVLALRQGGLLVEAPKFSKFLHGMALLYPHRLRNTPHWFLPELPPPLLQQQQQQQQQQLQLHEQRQREGNPGVGPKDDGTARVAHSRSRSGSAFSTAPGWVRTALWLRGWPRSRSVGTARGFLGFGGFGAGGSGSGAAPAMSPATLQELADAGDKHAQEVPHWLFPANIRPEQAQDIIPDPDSDSGAPPVGPRVATVPPTHGASHSRMAPVGPRQNNSLHGTEGRRHIEVLVRPANEHDAIEDSESTGGNNSKKSGNSSGSDYSRPSSVRSSYLPTVEAHSSVGPNPTRGSQASSQTVATDPLAGTESGVGSTAVVAGVPTSVTATAAVITAGRGVDVTYAVSGSSHPGPVSLVTVPSQTVMISGSSRKSRESNSSGRVAGSGGSGSGGGISGSGSGDSGNSGDGLGSRLSGGTAAAAATPALGKKWRKGMRVGSGGSGGGAHLSNLFATGARAFHIKAAMMAGELSQRSCRGVSKLKAAFQSRGSMARLSAPGGSPSMRLASGSGGGGSWLATKWEGLRNGHGGGGGGGGGGDDDVESGTGGFDLPRAAALVRTRVEPKTFFAAERTFLSWLNIAVLVMFTSLSLMSDRLAVFGPQPGAAAVPIPDGSVVQQADQITVPGGAVADAIAVRRGQVGCIPGGICQTSQIAGMAMAPVSMAFMFYALYMYRKRSAQILRREAVRYDDQRGPVLLTCMLIVVMVIAYVLTVKSVT